MEYALNAKSDCTLLGAELHLREAWRMLVSLAFRFGPPSYCESKLSRHRDCIPRENAKVAEALFSEFHATLHDRATHV